MRWKWLRHLTLAQALLLLLVPALLVLSLAELRVTSNDVKHAANTAYDRSLLGALKSIDASISTESGGLAVELPYRMFEFFELTASGPVHYRVATADGLVELGSADLPPPPKPLADRAPQFYDGEYFGEPVRVVAYQRELERPASDSPATRVVIQVAESTQSRREFTQLFVRRAAVSNIGFLLLTVASAVVAVVFVLRPLGRLSSELARRSASELSPLAVQALPADVRPLAAAVNEHMQRIGELIAQQREFLDDASHQLRTHLTTLRMQADYARGEDDPRQLRDALDALAGELQRATRSTNQLLALGRSDTVALEAAPFAANALLEDVAREFLPAARAAGIDLGIEQAAHEAHGDAALLHEALSNLVANAVQHVPRGGHVTLSAAQDALGASLSVEDDGPGLPPPWREAPQGRFTRAQRTGGGAGLGLAIARGIAMRHGGVLRLEPGAGERGLRATLWWPRKSS